MQFVFDNTECNISIINGTAIYHHGLGSISVANSYFSEITFQIKCLPHDSWPSNKSYGGIWIKSYHHPDTPALSKVTLKPVIGNCEMIQSSFINLLSNTSYLFEALAPGWFGILQQCFQWWRSTQINCHNRQFSCCRYECFIFSPFLHVKSVPKT